LERNWRDLTTLHFYSNITNDHMNFIYYMGLMVVA